MKPRIPSRTTLAALSFAMTLGAAHATSLTWDTSIAADGVITDGSGTWTNGAGNWNDGTTSVGVNWNNATPDSATFSGTVGGTITVAAGGVTQGGMIFNGNGNYTVSGGSISGAGSLTKNGTGTLTLSSANAFSGGATVSAGTLVIGGTASGAAGTGTVTLGDANTGANNVELDLSCNAATQISNNITVGASGTGTATIKQLLVNASPYIYLMSGTLTLNRATTLQATGASGNCYTNITGQITGNAGTLTVTGAETAATGPRWVFSNTTNNFTGALVIAAGGELGLNADGVIPDAVDVTVNGRLSVAKGGALAETIGALNGSGTIGDSASRGALTLTVGASGNDGAFSGVLATGGNGMSLVKTGAGTQTLSGTNTFTGGTVIRAGTLKMTSDGALSTGSITLNDASTGSANTTLTTNSNTGAGYRNALTVANQGTGTTTLEMTAQNASFAGESIQLNKATTVQSNYNGGGGAVLGKWDVTSVISGNVGTLTLRALGSGKLYVAGNNTFTGTVNITQGEVWAFGHVNAFGGSGNSVVMSGTATLGLYGAALNIGDLTGTTGNTLNTSVSGNNLLTISSANSATFAGAITGGGGLTKAGAGAQTLSGTNTYTGATAINAGVLVINGSTAAGSTLTVGGATASGTPTLKGSGTINGATTIAAAGVGVVGIHAPTAQTSGNGQTFASTLAYGSGSIFEWDLNASTSDTGSSNQGSYGQVIATGAAGSVTGGAAVFKVVLGSNNYTDAFWNTGKSWSNIFSGAGAPTSLSALFSSFSATGGLDSGGVVAGQGYFTMSSSSLTWTAVPEPTSALAGLLLGAGLLRRRRAGISPLR